MFNFLHHLIPFAYAADAPVGTGIGTFCGEGLGPFGEICKTATDKNSTVPLEGISRVISVVVGFITIVASIFLIFQLLIGAFQWIASSGDKNKLQQAQDRLTNAVVGLIIVAAAYGVSAIVGSILGIDIFLENPAGILKILMP